MKKEEVDLFPKSRLKIMIDENTCVMWLKLINIDQ